MVSCLKREYVGKGRKYHGKNWKGWKKIGDKIFEGAKAPSK